MAKIEVLICDFCEKAQGDDVARREWPWGGAPYEADACDPCWKPMQDALDTIERAMEETARKVPTTATRTRRDGGTRKVRRWAAENHIELGKGPTPGEVVEAWKRNDPSIARSRYVGEGEPPTVGTMPPDAAPSESEAASGVGT